MEQARELEREGLIRVRDRDMGYDVEKIEFPVEAVEKLCRREGVEDPRKRQLRRLEEMRGWKAGAEDIPWLVPYYEELIGKLEAVMQYVLRPENLIVSCTAEPEGIEAVKREIPSLKEALYTGAVPEIQEQEAPAPACRKEGLKTPSAVQYVARAGHISHYTGAYRILKVILSYEYLWIQVRVKGGAYGCMSGFGVYGDSYLASYRDPNLSETNQVFEHTADYVEHFETTDRDMTKYIIGTVSEMDTPLTPAAAGNRSMSAWLTHTEPADLQRTRDEVLDATAEDIRALAGGIRELLAEESLCAIGNENRIAQESGMFDQTLPLFHSAGSAEEKG